MHARFFCTHQNKFSSTPARIQRAEAEAQAQAEENEGYEICVLAVSHERCNLHYRRCMHTRKTILEWS